MTPLTEHQLLVFWVQLAVLLVAARGLGGLMRKINQPAVIGELAAGLLIGPTVLGRLAPGLFGWLFPEGDPVQSGLLLAVAWVGIALLLVTTGFETDLTLLRRLGGSTAKVALGSLLVPLALSFGLGLFVPSVFYGEAADTISFALFIAVAMSISALAIVGRILSDLRLMRRDIGQVMIGAVVANDLVGWMLLGVVAGIVTSGGFDLFGLGVTVLSISAFLALALTVGQHLVDRMLRLARHGEPGYLRSFTVIVGTALVAGAVTQAIGVEAVFGAFVAGILIGRSRYQRREVAYTLETVTHAFFAPLFFATAGLFVDLGMLAEPATALWAAVIVGVASLTKFAGTYAGARLGRLSVQESAALGVGLNARGTLEIVVATIGLGLGIFNAASYSTVVVLAMATSMMAPPLLRLTLGRLRPPPDEAARLEREAVMARSVVASTRQALLPTRGGGNSIIAGRILDLALQPDTSITIYTVARPGEDRALRAHADTAARELERSFADGRGVDRISRTADDPVEAICTEAGLGYGLLAVGMTEGALTARGLSPLLQRLVAGSPVPVLLVRHGVHLDAHLPELGFNRIMVAASGTRPARAAQEIAYTLGRSVGAPVDAVHVVNRPDRRAGAVSDEGLLQPVGAAAGTLNQAVELARQFGTAVTPHSRTGLAVGPELVSAAEELGTDLIVLGARVRSYEGEPFLGHAVEYLLDAAPQTVVLVVLPAAEEGQAAEE